MAGTIIGQGIVIEGEVTSDEAVIVAGTVRGKLTVDGPVTIEASGVVEADIGATSLSNGGSITGNVVVASEENVIRGETLVLQIGTRRTTIRPQPGQRVRGVFVPSENQGQPAQQQGR